MTLNQVHFMKNQKMIRDLVDKKLIYGLGISLVKITDDFLNLVSQYSNAVIHMINGVHTYDDFKQLYDKNLKILILGYKQFRRGADYYNDDVAFEMERNYVFLPEIVEHFAVVSFDNLSLDQLKVKDMMSKADWDKFYMGNDGQFTMFVDSVSKTYSKSSTTPLKQRRKLLANIKTMFEHIKATN